MCDVGMLLEYDLARHCLAVLRTPDNEDHSEDWDFRYNLFVVAEDGGLGVTEAMDPELKLWSWKNNKWVLSRVIDLHYLLPHGSVVYPGSMDVLGFAEEANALFVRTFAGLFTIEL